MARPDVAPARVPPEEHELVEALDDARPRALRRDHRELDDLRVVRSRRGRERAPRVEGRDQVPEDDDPIVAGIRERRLVGAASVEEARDPRALELPLEHREVAATLPDDRQVHYLTGQQGFLFFPFFSLFLAFGLVLFYFWGGEGGGVLGHGLCSPNEDFFSEDTRTLQVSVFLHTPFSSLFDRPFYQKKRLFSFVLGSEIERGDELTPAGESALQRPGLPDFSRRVMVRRATRRFAERLALRPVGRSPRIVAKRLALFTARAGAGPTPTRCPRRARRRARRRRRPRTIQTREGARRARRHRGA